MKKNGNKTGILTRFLVFMAGVFVLTAMGAGLSGCAENGGATTEALLDSESSAVTAPDSAVDMPGQNASEEMQSRSDQSSGMADAQETGQSGAENAVQNADQNRQEYMAQDPETSQSGPDTTEEDQAPDTLEVHFLDVGQGDSTLIICGEEAMLIDAGDNDQGTKIQNYLRNQGVESLKYVICTHQDEDHIGGMDVILYKFDCETILMTDEEVEKLDEIKKCRKRVTQADGYINIIYKMLRDGVGMTL